MSLCACARRYEAERITDGQHYALKVTELNALTHEDRVAVSGTGGCAPRAGAMHLHARVRRARSACSASQSTRAAGAPECTRLQAAAARRATLPRPAPLFVCFCEQVVEEIRLLASLKHPTIVNYYEAFCDHGEGNKGGGDRPLQGAARCRGQPAAGSSPPGTRRARARSEARAGRAPAPTAAAVVATQPCPPPFASAHAPPFVQTSCAW